MPGTIQVSVLDFMGLQSSLPSSQISIKVSMGKTEYQTWDKGDFSFPLTNLRDNLIVTLLDAEGNEVSHAGVDTRLVIDKGIWDDVFPLEGGGHVHMKLQFVLSEEDRQRIRIMRESALRKKHDELLNGELRSPEFATIGGSNTASSLQPNHEVSDSQKSLLQSEVVGTQAGLTVTPPSTLLKNGKSDPEDRKGTHFVQKQTMPNACEDNSSTTPMPQGFTVHAKEVSYRSLVEKSESGASAIDVPARTICSEEASCFRSSGSAVAAKNKIPMKLKGDGANDQKKQSPMEKTNSNVRNIISAFESSLNQDIRPKIRSPPTKSHFSRTGVVVPLKHLQLNDVKTENIEPMQSTPSRVRNPFHTGDGQRAPTHIRKSEEQIALVRALPGATSSQDTGQLEELRAAHICTKGTNVDLMNNLKLTNKEKEADIEEEKSLSGDLVRASTGGRASVSGRILNEHSVRQPFSNLFARKRLSGGNLLKNSGKGTQPRGSQEVNIRGAVGDGHYSSECYGAWIFPDEGKRLCMTTAGKQIMNLMGSCGAEAKSLPRKMSSSVAENLKERSLCGGTGIEATEGEKTSHRHRKSKLEVTTDHETSRGPIGQVMRIAIMVGFATLVLFTRQ